MHVISRIRRFGIYLAATIVCVLAGVVVANATQVLTTPNAAMYTYNLAGGAASSPITPASNTAVLMLGTQTTVGYRGVAMATILHVPNSFIEWTGLESTSPSAITEGFDGTTGTHILWLDFAHQVDVEVAGPDTIYIHNGATDQRTGTLELIW